MIESDPNFEQLGIFGNYGQTSIVTASQGILYDQVYAPVGRLRQAASHLKIDVEWAGDPPDFSVFENFWESVAYGTLLLQRDPIRDVYLEDTGFPLESSSHPGCVYRYPHWISSQSGGEYSAGYANYWYLYYGTEVGLIAMDNLTPELSWPYPDSPWDLYPVDSLIESDTSDPFNVEAVIQRGWGLHCIGRRPEFVDGVITHYTFAYLFSYQLKNEKGPAATAMLDLTRKSRWELARNTLAYPIHELVLSPWQP